jgi:hypothetical protein
LRSRSASISPGKVSIVIGLALTVRFMDLIPAKNRNQRGI